MKLETFFLVTDPQHDTDELGDFVAEASLRGLINLSNGTRGGPRGFFKSHPTMFTKESEALDEAHERFYYKFNAVPPGNISRIASTKDTLMSVDTTSDIINKYKKIAADGNPATTEHEKGWQAYMKKQMSKRGIDSMDDLDEGAKKKFFEDVDKGWNAKDEPGKDGEISAVVAKYKTMVK